MKYLKILVLLLLSFSAQAVEVEKTKSNLLTDFADGQTKTVTAEKIRNLVVSSVGMTMGAVDYFNTTGTVITIANQSDGSTNLVRLNPTTTNYTAMNFDNGGANDGRLRKKGALTKHCHVAITLSGSPVTNNDSFVAGVAKNGTALSTCKVQQRFGSSTDTQVMTYHCNLDMAVNDTLDPVIGNLTGGRNLTLKSLNVFAMCMQ